MQRRRSSPIRPRLNRGEAIASDRITEAANAAVIAHREGKAVSAEDSVDIASPRRLSSRDVEVEVMMFEEFMPAATLS